MVHTTAQRAWELRESWCCREWAVRAAVLMVVVAMAEVQIAAVMRWWQRRCRQVEVHRRRTSSR